MRSEHPGGADDSVSEVVGATLAQLGVDTVFGLLGSGNAIVTNALVSPAVRGITRRGMSAARPRWPTGGPASRAALVSRACTKAPV